jgi:TRAP-type C4-dicarboxylate transport system permease small subunit
MTKSASDAKRSGRDTPPIRVLNIIDKSFEKFETYVLAYGIILMALNTIANVFGRNLFNQSLYFSEELNQFLIVLVTWVGLGYASRKGRHIRMSALYDQLSDPLKKALMIVMCLGTGAVMFVLAYYSFQYIDGLMMRGTVTPALGVPQWMTYIWVPIGFIITGIQYFLTVVRNLRAPEVYISYTEVDAYDESDPTVGSGI